MGLVTQMDPFVGKYYSVDYIRRHVLGQKDKDLKEMDKQIQSEINSGLVMDPTQVNMFDTMDRQNTAFAPELQGIQADDSFDREQDSADANLDRELQKQKSLPPSQPKDK